MESPGQNERPINLAIGRAIVGGRWGFLIGIFAGGLFMLLAWGWSPRALVMGSAIALSSLAIGLVSGLATGAAHGRVVVLRAMIGSLVASPVIVAVTIVGIPRLFHYWVFTGEHKRLVCIILKSVSPIHFGFAVVVGLIVGIIIARMREDPYFVIGLRS